MKWTAEAEAEILRRIAQGEAVHRICNDDWLPCETAVYKRKLENEDFAKKYAQAREDQGDRFFDEGLAIVDAATPETVGVARLQYDARKWAASKLRPKAYGDKLDLSGNVGLTVNIIGKDVDL